MYLALTAPADGAPLWGEQWISDFERVMSLPQAENPTDEEDDIPHFSLVTGKLVYSEASRPMRVGPKTTIKYDTVQITPGMLVKRETQVSVREDGTVAVKGVRSLAGEKLAERSWRGLEIENMGEGDEGAAVEIGRHGVAREYRSV